jgi:MFS family permease
VWSAAVIISPYLGPFIACWIVGHTSWRWTYWSLAILNAVAWLFIVFCMDETFYPRHISPGQFPIRKSRALRLLGIEQRKTNLIPNTFWQAGMSSWTAITKLPVLLNFVYYFMTFAWAIAANITIGVFVISLYNFTFDNLGKSSFSLACLNLSDLTLHSSVVPCSDPRHDSW